jgi:hypothetical protein
MRSYTCKTCGAELILNDETNFTNCLYCGNSIAITNSEIIDLNVKKIIPFSIEKEEAIEKYKKIIGKEIIDAKKVYVPVRYCRYDFDYLLYYEYRVESEDSDGHTSVSYYDTETLIDGNVNDEIIFGDGKIDNVHLAYEIRHQQRLDFDPVLLKDVSIECSNFDDSNLIKKSLEQDVRAFGRKRIKRDISEIYSENYFIYGVNYEPFTTLIPVYIVKTDRGEIYNYPGVNPVEALKKSSTANLMRNFSIFLVVASLIMIFKFSSDTSFYFTYQKYHNLTIISFIAGFILLLVSLTKKRNITIEHHENYDYEKYELGDHRKNIK